MRFELLKKDKIILAYLYDDKGHVEKMELHTNIEDKHLRAVQMAVNYLLSKGKKS